MSDMDEKPYAGVTVLDMSQGMAGPYCAAVLGQQGARVIKVEPPAGDWIRVQGGGKDGMTALAVTNNLGKRSICIDATKPEGRALILELAKRADVLVENFRPGVMLRLGLDYAALKQVNPALIYVSVTGFGATGPYAKKPATDSVMQAMTGMAVANKDGAGQPRRIGIYVPDTVTALYAAQCVSSALYARSKPGSGRGRHIQVSLAECCIAFQSGAILDDFLFAGQYKQPIGVPAGVFATRDGYMVITTLQDQMWQGLCRALGREDWLAEPRYASSASRGRVTEELTREVARIMAERDTREWTALFEQHDILFAPVQNYPQLREDPQVLHMGYFGETEQPPYGKLPVPYLPGSERGDALPAAPRAGEHSREILAELGYSAERIAALEQAGLVRQAS